MKHRKCHVTYKWRQFACAFARVCLCVCVCVWEGGGGERILSSKKIVAIRYGANNVR